jgi:hypothetical protein
VTPDEAMEDAYRAAGLPPRSQWTQQEWLDFLDGWSFTTIGVPKREDQDRRFFRIGAFEAAFRRAWKETPSKPKDKVSIQELAAHYAAAARGDKHRALLLALDAGFEFNQVVTAMGDEGLRIAFSCIEKGWIDRGMITEAGRAHLAQGAEA